MVRHCAEIYSINFNLILISLLFLSLMRRCVVNNATTTTAFPSGDMGIAVDVSGANYDYLLTYLLTYYYCHYYFCTSIHMGLFFRLFFRLYRAQNRYTKRNTSGKCRITGAELFLRLNFKHSYPRGEAPWNKLFFNRHSVYTSCCRAAKFGTIM